jgi:CheY-like chemotaxis protein
VSDSDAPSPVGVLIVSDDPALLRLLDLALQKHHFTIHSAPNGAQAVDLYGRFQHAIGVVLLEVDMYRMDGVQTMVASRVSPDTGNADRSRQKRRATPMPYFASAFAIFLSRFCAVAREWPIRV